MRFREDEIEVVPSLYGLDIADLDGDARPDLVAGSTAEPFLAWYRAPDWRRTIISREHRGNIGVAIHDIDGDGRPDVAVASGFNPGIQAHAAYLHWLRQPENADDDWTSVVIDQVPFIHRIGWADVDGDGRPELVTATIRGPEGKHLDWSDPGWLGFYRIPDDPAKDPWPLTVIDGHLHLNHGLSFARLSGGAAADILVGARDGLFWYEYSGNGAWERHRVSDRETSEVAVLHGASGEVLGIAAVEPWHGNILCWYQAPADLRTPGWVRHEIADDLEGGHSLACADLDEDGRPEIVTGSFRPGTDLRVYRALNGALSEWECHRIDGELGPGQTYVLDLDGDGRLEIVSSGLSTGNLKAYFCDLG